MFIIGIVNLAVLMSARRSFSIKFKNKRRSRKLCPVNPFPLELARQCTGVFTGISVEVCSPSDIVNLYKNGFYGKGNKSRGCPQIAMSEYDCKTLSNEDVNCEETLILSLEEAFFLNYFMKALKIVDIDGEEIACSELLHNVQQTDPKFLYSLAAYLYLKAKGWIVKSGLKYGGHFIIYKNGPEFYHASFVVKIYVCDEDAPSTTIEIKGLQRIAESCNKEVLILSISIPHNFHLNDMQDIANLSISESIIKRFHVSKSTPNNVSK